MPGEASTRQFLLREFLEEFDWATSDFYERRDPPRSFEHFLHGASAYFHQRLIRIGREKAGFPSGWAAGDLHFIELLYAMLSAWGMDSQKSGLKDFPEFTQAVEALVQSDIFRTFEGQHVRDVDERWEPRLRELWDLLSTGAKIMAGQSVLVGSSKLLHHLLPDLFPPIDRTYTLDFLSHLSDEPYRISQEERLAPGFTTFSRAMLFFRHVARQKPNLEIDPSRAMSDSVPKIIDNAIIAWWTAPWDKPRHRSTPCQKS